MTANEAIEKLDEMQRQIIHGSHIFGDIAEVIRRLVKRNESLQKAASPVTHNPEEDAFYEKAESSIGDSNRP